MDTLPPHDGTPVNVPQPAKKVSKRKTAVEGEQRKRKKRKGSLSVLPTLPLDILYEIFAHLGPGDLLHISRTTKSFRDILMTRQSAFIWKEVLDASVEDGHPSRPVNMSEPKWTALVFGKPWCTACGARTSSSVIWMLRVRLCTDCMMEQLRLVHISMSTIPHRDPGLRLHFILPTECVNYPSRHRQTKTLQMVLAVKDLESYKGALRDLRETYPDDRLFEEQRKLFDQDMTSTLQARQEHATECGKIESARAACRGSELQDIKRDRAAEIRRRLIALGYEARDVDHRDLQKHKDVWAPRPLSERVWKNIEPLVKQCVENIRRQRIQEEIACRRRERENLVGQVYLDFLRAISHSTLSFMPSLAKVVELPPVADSISADMSTSDDMLAPVKTALASSGPNMIDWMQRRAQLVRDLLPDDWPRARNAKLGFSVDPSVELGSFAPGESFRDLDLVAYTWNHSLGHPSIVLYGLDVVAQQNDSKHDQVRAKPAKGAHLAIMQILVLLGLDPAETTVSQMYRLADSELFVCETCVASGTHLARGKIYFKSWKTAVAHATTCHCKPNDRSPKFRLASPLERRYVSAYRREHPPVGNAPEDDQPYWGCCHCDYHLHKPATSPNARQSWYPSSNTYSTGALRALPSIKAHLEQTHGLLNVTEDADFFWSRQWIRPVSCRGAFVPSLGLEEATEKLESEVS